MSKNPAATAATVLIKARAKLRRGWCQGPAAMARSGKAVMPRSPTACKWCAYGAVLASTRRSAAIGWAMRMFEQANRTNMIRYNEGRGRNKNAVIAAFDRAIAKAQRDAVTSPDETGAPIEGRGD